jgi:TolB-like protein/Tfp pilus assembly protein PilF
LRLTLLLAELKRRKVLRVAAAYGATSFLLLQAADIIFPALGLPRWAMTLVVALAIIGFPMAMVLAWTFESSEQGLRRTPPPGHGELEEILAQPRSRRWGAGIAALVGVVLLVGGIAWTLSRGEARSDAYDSIAVLPFTNLSGQAENEYFGDGLAEELLNALAGIEGLKVAARTSAFAFKDSHMDVRQIGDTLGVATVLEGSVRRSADNVRITAQLIDARTGYHIWSETYDRPLTDLFAVQDAIANEIVNALASRFTTSDEGLYRGGTADVEAYDLYLLGRQKWVTRELPLLREAIGHFEDALARDSSFALAWSGLADAIDALAFRSREGVGLVPRAKNAAQRAILLDPKLAEGWASLGVLALDFDHDFPVAELALRNAISVRPSSAIAHHWLADVMRYSGRLEESIEPEIRALELDPASSLAMHGHFTTLCNLGRWQEARVWADRLLAAGQTDLGRLVNIFAAAPRMGFQADDLEKFAVAIATPRYSRPQEAAVMAAAVHDATMRGRALQVVQRMSGEGMPGQNAAKLCMVLGDRECALFHLERGFRERDAGMLLVGTDWIYDPLRTDPRFVRIIDQLGLPNGRL